MDKYEEEEQQPIHLWKNQEMKLPTNITENVIEIRTIYVCISQLVAFWKEYSKCHSLSRQKKRETKDKNLISLIKKKKDE